MRVSTVLQGGREVENPKWEWMDTIFGWGSGIVSTVAVMTGWTSLKFKAVEERERKLREEIEKKIQELHGRVTPLAVEVAELRVHHQATIHRLSAIDTSIQGIDRKQDEQTRILYHLSGQTKARSEDDSTNIRHC